MSHVAIVVGWLQQEKIPTIIEAVSSIRLHKCVYINVSHEDRRPLKLDKGHFKGYSWKHACNYTIPE